MTLNPMPQMPIACDPIILGPTWRSRTLQMIVDRNPFYLLSAACMLGGCLALTNSLSWLSLPLPRLLTLIVTINLYEALLVGLAMLLMARGLARDARILLTVEAFFLVDVTFLNAEVVTASLRVGTLVSAGLLVLSAGKLRLIMRTLGADLSPARFVYTLAQLAVLLAIPCVLRRRDHGSVSPLNFHAIWWVVGLLPVVQEIATRIWGVGHRQRVPAAAAVYLVLPWISLIAHLGILHYVYDATFYGAMATPVLLGLALLVNRATPETTNARLNLLALRLLLPLAAVAVSWNNPSALAFSLRPLASASVSTSMLAGAAAYLTFIYCFLLPAAVFFLSAGAIVVLAMLFGPSPADVRRVSWQTWSWSINVIDRIVPKTLAGWGVVSVLASFFFLLIGGWISLSAPRPQKVEPAPNPEGGAGL